MQRRKFIAAIGSVAAGAAAVTGTGAFTSVTAERSIEVNVADDSAAFLRVVAGDTPNADEYVDTSDGTISLDFTSAGAATGANQNATTVFDDLLNIENQGTQPVIVGHRQDFAPQEGALYHEDYEDSTITRVGDVPGEFEEVDGDIGDPDNNITNLDTASLKNLPVLEVGDVLEDVGFFITPGADPAEDFIDGNITFAAGAEPSDIGLQPNPQD
jgi:hypothetical protein